MDAFEPKEKQDQERPGVTINVNAPDNCVFAGDRIEINIHLEDRTGPNVSSQPDASKSTMRNPQGAHELLASTAEKLLMVADRTYAGVPATGK